MSFLAFSIKKNYVDSLNCFFSSKNNTLSGGSCFLFGPLTDCSVSILHSFQIPIWFSLPSFKIGSDMYMYLCVYSFLHVNCSYQEIFSYCILNPFRIRKDKIYK